MYIKIQFSEDGLFGAESGATAGINVQASKDAFARGLTAKLEREFPGAEVEVTEGLEDRHMVDGQAGTDEAVAVGEVMHRYWEAWDWLIDLDQDDIDRLTDDAELLVVYVNSRDYAWEALGDNAAAFDDNGEEPDGPSYYQAIETFEPEQIDEITSRHLGHVQWGKRIKYGQGGVSRDWLDRIAPNHWCGYQAAREAFYIAG